jgi:membrane protease YdiL (CAAX protease family)
LAARIPASWRAFGRFLQRPVLPDRASGPGLAGLQAIGKLFPLDLLVMALLIGTLGVLTAFGFELPKHALEGLDIGPWLIVFMLLGAPIGEEIVFRGWLSGRPGHVAALLVLLAGAVVAVLAARSLPSPASGLAMLGVSALTVAGIARRCGSGATSPPGTGSSAISAGGTWQAYWLSPESTCSTSPERAPRCCR